MKRRKALKTISLATGGGIILPTTLFTACQSDGYLPIFFTKKDITLLNEIGETILPETEEVPGAKALKVANFIDVFVADCYDLKQQKIIQVGLVEFRKNCKAIKGKPFLQLTNQQRHNWLVQLDKAAKSSESNHYFSLLKNLILFAFFTSKEGAGKALRYVPIPGKYKGNYPIAKGDKAWAL